MPPEIAVTFTPAQIEALRRAFREPRKHTIDLRLSLPFFRNWFYLVLLIGEERRSVDRRRMERASHPLLTPANVLFMTVMLGLFLAASTVVVAGVFNLPIAGNKVHPAAIPWLKNQRDCEQTGRTWLNDRCLDYDHNPSF
ncbi:hypothetical protein BST81_24450 [Leptolyngbya sp. 'hensonii']|nr:hypothetical protein BST81_24450 [Leptolyngbya sp. 'hensonii']